MPTLGRRIGSAEEPRDPRGDPRSPWKTREERGAEPRPAARREAGASSESERPRRKTRFPFRGQSTGDGRRDLEGGAQWRLCVLPPSPPLLTYCRGSPRHAARRAGEPQQK
ncbi:hypothetical protein NDU88_000681 [Pleurodeles waltl]|uniref:Uncharacterized protein n=1 Tax=Pleurodeles waltl TaxID=8319 RepID=A0AAV7P4K5_PLEWA|nr:hypothetical protein NDU88_000681 [Pleurodeles waltl]